MTRLNSRLALAGMLSPQGSLTHIRKIYLAGFARVGTGERSGLPGSNASSMALGEPGSSRALNSFLLTKLYHKKKVKSFCKGLKHPSPFLLSCCSTLPFLFFYAVTLGGCWGLGRGVLRRPCQTGASVAHLHQGRRPGTSSVLQMNFSSPLPFGLFVSINNGWRGCKKDLQWLGGGEVKGARKLWRTRKT